MGSGRALFFVRLSQPLSLFAARSVMHIDMHIPHASSQLVWLYVLVCRTCDKLAYEVLEDEWAL